MIQRIQSIYLLLAGLAVFGLFGVPFAGTAEAVSTSSLFKDGVFDLADNPIMMGLFIGAGTLAIIAIFLFKNRTLQMNIGKLSILLLLGGMGLAAYFYMQDEPLLAGHKAQLGLGIALPVLSAIFVFLANKSIKKDENLVKSMDRLR